MSRILEILEKTRLFFERLVEIVFACHDCCNSQCFTETLYIESDVKPEDVVSFLEIFERYNVSETLFKTVNGDSHSTAVNEPSTTVSEEPSDRQPS